MPWHVPLLTGDDTAVLQQVLTTAVEAGCTGAGSPVAASIATAGIPVASPSLLQNCTAAAGPAQ